MGSPIILKVSSLEKGTGFHLPTSQADIVTPDSPAIEVMTDLKQIVAATVRSDVLLSHANHLMISRGVRSLIVTDSKGDVVGLLIATDVLGEKPMQCVQKQGLKHGEITVKNVMTPQSDIEVLTLKQVARAKVLDVIETLKAHNRNHALVVDVDPLTNRQMVRGIFSASQIARQLGVTTQIHSVAKTFAQIEAVLAS
ncbi:MAG: CBS domain protein [Fluviibacter phosphoraccumulans EoVTN8]